MLKRVSKWFRVGPREMVAVAPTSLEVRGGQSVRNYALASGLELADAVTLKKTPSHYMIVVTVLAKDAGSQFAKDIARAYRSPEFRRIAERDFPEYVKLDYLK